LGGFYGAVFGLVGTGNMNWAPAFGIIAFYGLFATLIIIFLDWCFGHEN